MYTDNEQTKTYYKYLIITKNISDILHLYTFEHEVSVKYYIKIEHKISQKHFGEYKKQNYIL